MKAGTSVIFLPCRDIEKTRHFYHEILGLPIEQKQGENLYIFDTGYGYWGFVQYHDGRSPLSGPARPLNHWKWARAQPVQYSLE